MSATLTVRFSAVLASALVTAGALALTLVPALPASSAQSAPTADVRDHRNPTADVRVYRTPTADVRDHRTPTADVRDHRTPTAVVGNTPQPPASQQPAPPSFWSTLPGILTAAAAFIGAIAALVVAFTGKR